MRERLTAGDTDEQARQFLVARYGDFVLLKPPFKPETIVLWLAPFGLLALGGLAMLLSARKRSEVDIAAAPLSAEEAKKLADVLGEGPRSG